MKKKHRWKAIDSEEEACLSNVAFIDNHELTKHNLYRTDFIFSEFPISEENNLINIYDIGIRR
jgi:hypothetical protein